MSTSFDSLLLDESPDAIVVTSPSGVVLHWSRSAQLLYGFSPEEAVGYPLDELVIPSDRAVEEKQMLEEAAERGVATYEAFRQRKDLSLLYVMVTTKTLYEPDGRVRYFISSKTDVTHLKVKREARLVSSKFRDLLETMPDAVVMANATGRIVLANSHAETLFGYDQGELVGTQVESLLPPRYRGGHVGFRQAYFQAPRPRSMGVGLELFGLRKDGREVPVEISLGPINTEEGTMVISAIRDISERKQIQLDLHQKNLELQNAAQAKNRFLANMSHELRTPLNGVIGFAEFLAGEKPGPLNEKQQEYLADILNSGRHLLQLINDVLDLAKVEAGKMEVHPSQFDLKKAIEEVCAVVRPLSQKKAIQLSLEVSGDLSAVTQDESKLKQVLYNLLSNAVKFTDDRGRVEIRAHECDEGGFELAVRDTGIGIRPTDVHRLFKEFEQLESGESRRYEGTGLGLALTRRIVELLGGGISLESELGVGSVFKIRLPLRLEKPIP